MSDINKIIRVLDLSRSETRDQTLDSIVKFVLYSQSGSGVRETDIKKLIEKELDIQIHQHDIGEAVNRLLDQNLIVRNSQGLTKLTDEAAFIIRKDSLNIREERNSRKEFFSKNISDISQNFKYDITKEEIDELWEVFKTFIYDCYLTHGKDAVESLLSETTEIDTTIRNIVNKYISQVHGKKKKKILEKYINIYPNIVDSKILEYLKSLADKTESFYALGLSQDEYDTLYKDLKFDWIVFVDTNFLYSILDLHNNPEKDAAKCVLQLGSEMGIKFRYTTKTYDELNSRKKDFDKYLEKDLVPSQIKALLQSGRLDAFAESYYEKLLSDREHTPHPSEIIMHSQNSMKEKNLVIYNSRFDALKKNEEYLKDQESQFNSYLLLLDEIREEKGLMRKGTKDPVQVQHDIFLREAILHLRSSNVTSMSSAKYFGLTLDKTLIKFDAYQLRHKSVGTVIPTFFKPSFLLKKLLKQAPLKTKENYLRAFIKTISKPVIETNKDTSKVTIRSLKYFHNLGISNESLILDCLRDELFIKTYEKLEGDQDKLDKFVESELNKQIQSKTSRIKELENSVDITETKLNKAMEYSTLTKEENQSLSKKSKEISKTLKLYERELKKLKNQTRRINDLDPSQLNIYHEQKNIEEEDKLKKKDKLNATLIEELVQEKLRKRKLKGIAFLLVALFCLISLVLLYFFVKWQYNYMSFVMSSLSEYEDEGRKVIGYGIITSVLGIAQIPLFIKSYDYLFNLNKRASYIKEIKKDYKE